MAVSKEITNNTGFSVSGWVLAKYNVSTTGKNWEDCTFSLDSGKSAPITCGKKGDDSTYLETLSFRVHTNGGYYSIDISAAMLDGETYKELNNNSKFDLEFDSQTNAPYMKAHN